MQSVKERKKKEREKVFLIFYLLEKFYEIIDWTFFFFFSVSINIFSFFWWGFSSFCLLAMSSFFFPPEILMKLGIDWKSAGNLKIRKEKWKRKECIISFVEALGPKVSKRGFHRLRGGIVYYTYPSMRYLASSFPLSPRNDWEDANCRTQSNLKYKSNKHQPKNIRKPQMARTKIVWRIRNKKKNLQKIIWFFLDNKRQNKKERNKTELLPRRHSSMTPNFLNRNYSCYGGKSQRYNILSILFFSLSRLAMYTQRTWNT